MANDLRLGGNGQNTESTASDLADLTTLANVSPGEDAVDLDDLRMPQDFQASGGATPIWTSIPIHPGSELLFQERVHDPRQR